MPNFEHIDIDIELEEKQRKADLAAMSAGLDALETGLKMLPVSIAMFAASARHIDGRGAGLRRRWPRGG